MPLLAGDQKGRPQSLIRSSGKTIPRSVAWFDCPRRTSGEDQATLTTEYERASRPTRGKEAARSLSGSPERYRPPLLCQTQAVRHRCRYRCRRRGCHRWVSHLPGVIRVIEDHPALRARITPDNTGDREGPRGTRGADDHPCIRLIWGVSSGAGFARGPDAAALARFRHEFGLPPISMLRRDTL